MRTGLGIVAYGHGSLGFCFILPTPCAPSSEALGSGARHSYAVLSPRLVAVPSKP